MRCWKESARHEHTDFFGRIPVVQSCGEVLLPPVDHVAYVHAHMLHVHVHVHVHLHVHAHAHAHVHVHVHTCTHALNAVTAHSSQPL